MKKGKNKISGKILESSSIIDNSKIFEETDPIKWSKEVLEGKKKVIVKSLPNFEVIDNAYVPFEWEEI